MLKTEEEAKQCWCPFARVLVLDQDVVRQGGEPALVAAASNRWQYAEDPRNPQMSRCIASQCMMWRWADDRQNRKMKYAGEYGYCGLAGKPED